MQSQFTDATGIRVITFLNSDVREIEAIIKRTFAVDVPNSLDRSGALGTDKVGYRSVHYVCLLGDKRASNLEYKDLCDLKFEVQIRTVLQHAWAELAHDRSYKFGVSLPPDLERSLNLYSGLLEIADRGFEELSARIDAYTQEVNDSSPEEWTTRSIDSITLTRFVEQLATSKGIMLSRTFEAGESAEAVGELQAFGLHSIAELSAITSDPKVEKFLNERVDPSLTGIGLLRSMMMAHDMERYFEKVQFRWIAIAERTHEILVSIWGEQKVKILLDKRNILVPSKPPARKGKRA
jgi:hypothetical protein